MARTAAVVVGLVAAPASAQSPTGTEAEAVVDGIVLRYAVTGPADGEPLLLIGGTESQLTDWPRPWERMTPEERQRFRGGMRAVDRPASR